MPKNMYQKREERQAKRNNDSNEEIMENKTNINWGISVQCKSSSNLYKIRIQF